jgi:hypothetical protein
VTAKEDVAGLPPTALGLAAQQARDRGRILSEPKFGVAMDVRCLRTCSGGVHGQPASLIDALHTIVVVCGLLAAV